MHSNQKMIAAARQFELEIQLGPSERWPKIERKQCHEVCVCQCVWHVESVID